MYRRDEQTTTTRFLKQKKRQRLWSRRRRSSSFHSGWVEVSTKRFTSDPHILFVPFARKQPFPHDFINRWLAWRSCRLVAMSQPTARLWFFYFSKVVVFRGSTAQLPLLNNHCKDDAHENVRKLDLVVISVTSNLCSITLLICLVDLHNIYNAEHVCPCGESVYFSKGDWRCSFKLKGSEHLGWINWIFNGTSHQFATIRAAAVWERWRDFRINGKPIVKESYFTQIREISSIKT